VPKSFTSTISTFAKNIGLHIKRVATRQQTPAEAWVETLKDVDKLRHAFAKVKLSESEREAEQLVDAGRQAYNVKDYEKAEAFFRQAIVADKNHCLAHTYLGYALYKMGRLTEAEGSWQRALAVAPNFQAGEKARQKLLHLEKKKKQAVNDIEERLREGKGR